MYARAERPKMFIQRRHRLHESCTFVLLVIATLHCSATGNENNSAEPMTTAEHVLNCSFEQWCTQFKSVSFRSKLVSLPRDFVDYVVQDGVHLPEHNSALPKRSRPDPADEYRDWTDDDSDSISSAEVPSLQSVLTAAEQGIAELGGKIIPKLNWSCPKDATWVTSSNSIACANADEVLLLLKSSDRIAHDICHAFDGCQDQPQEPVQYVLVLKKYYDLKPEREFRCFIKGHDLVGVCQREVTQHFPALADQQDELEESILEFFEEHIQHKFPDPDYTMDVYAATNGRVKLMDFNPVGGSTAALLFDWNELGYGTPEQPLQASMAQQSVRNAACHPKDNCTPGAKPLDFRIITEPVALRPNKGAYGVPFDLVDTSTGSAVSEMLQQIREADTALAAMHVMDANNKHEE